MEKRKNGEEKEGRIESREERENGERREEREKK